MLFSPYMPVSHFEHNFYALCLQKGVTVFSLKQDTKQDIGKDKKIKNIDFICYSNSKIFLIDVKGTSNLSGDTKVSTEDIKVMKYLQGLFGKNAVGLFVYFWSDAIHFQEDKEIMLQEFKIKAIDVDLFNANKKLQTGWGNKFYRCPREIVKNIWDYIPEFKP